MFYVYLLQSIKNNELYIGSTNDLKRRLAEHNRGIEISTKRYLPWRLVMYEAYLSEDDAREREKKLKAHGNAIRELKKRSRRSLKNGAGFTLVEIIVVMGLTMLILGIGSYFAFDNFQRYLFRKEQDTTVAVLMKARSRAMNNFFEKPHGVHIESDAFTLFRGLNYTDDPSTYEVIPGTSSIEKSGATNIVFEQLRGRPAGGVPQDVSLSYGASSITISINDEGRIDW